MRRLFAVAEARPVRPTLARCDLCRLDTQCRSPRQPVSGRGLRKILIVGEAPGELEDRQSVPLAGNELAYLKRSLARHGADLDRDCWLTNALLCKADLRRTREVPKQVEYCRPNVLGSIRSLQPTSILLLGSVAVKSVLTPLWGEDPKGVNRWDGWRIPSQELNAWVIPAYHPGYVLRQKATEVYDRRFDEAVAFALGCASPWPDGKPQRRIEYPGESEVAQAVEYFCRSAVPVAFDYETNMLKPGHPKSRLYCCALSDGTTTISYPMVGNAVEATKRFLLSPVRKVGANAKFESAWSEAVLGVSPRNVAYDVVVEGHLLDSRKGVAGVKFQSFVRLGEPPYSRHVEAYLKGKRKGGYSRNRIRDMDRTTLLKYCGMDALLEWEIARHQTESRGKEFR